MPKQTAQPVKEEYWNIHEILRYQRNFMLINSERSIGKTYTTQKWVIEKCLKEKRQFAYIVRTKDQKKKGVFQQAFEKVEKNEFKGKEFSWDTETLTIDGELVGWCFALSESQQLKQRSFPNVDYFIFDEYIIEKDSSSSYVKGMAEPTLLLSIYDTVDRREDRVKVFMLANNATFYNPYHLNPAFPVANIELGKIWKNENVLYQRPIATEWVRRKNTGTKFARMVDSTDYGRFATRGEFIEDEETFIAKHEGTARYSFTIRVGGINFGIWTDMNVTGLMYVSEKVDPSCPIIYALTLDDQSENTLVTKVKSAHINRFTQAVKQGVVRYESMLIKKMCEKAIAKLI